MYALMVTPNAFPNGDAGAVRDYAFACIYRDLGYGIVHFGNGACQQGLYRGITYRSFRIDANSFIEKARRKLVTLDFFKNAYRELVAERGFPALIHLYDVDEAIFRFFVTEAQRLSIPILHDSVEWYSPCQFKLGRLDYRYILKDRLNSHLVSNPVKVIAISEYLREYFSEKGLKTIVVPVIMDSDDYKKSHIAHECDKVKLMYAGSPAAKDFLPACVRALGNLPDDIRAGFQMDVYGASMGDVAHLFDGGLVPAEIHVHGRVAREEVLEALNRADFSMLLRPEDERYAQAGFPTKVVEAMMCGCPMLCNLSSDLSKYLIGGENSIIVDGHTEEDMLRALIEISKMPRDKILNMKERARQDAVRFFDYRKYKDAVDRLIHE